MPTYEYACTTCGHHLEVVQSFTDEPLTACPECGAPLRKVFGAVGIVLKGSGFYKTDSRSAAQSSSGGNGSTSEGGGSDSATAKESVPASKPAESSATPASSPASAPAAN
jgi:putative FmdB family regulatory protein